MDNELINANGIIDSLYHLGFENLADDLSYVYNKILSSRDDISVNLQSLLGLYDFAKKYNTRSDNTSASISDDGNASLTWTITKNKNLTEQWGKNQACISLGFEPDGMIQIGSTTGHLPYERINQLRISGLFDQHNALTIVEYFINCMSGGIYHDDTD